jgi:HK97 gp10 family phage protein
MARGASFAVTPGNSSNILELSVRNASAVIANVQQFDARAREEIRALVQQYAEATRTLVRDLAPVDRGYMHDHVRVRYSPEGFAFEVGWDAADFLGEGLAFYPFFQEFGTRFMPPQPSLGPAWAVMGPQFQLALRLRLAELAATRVASMAGAA